MAQTAPRYGRAGAPAPAVVRRPCAHPPLALSKGARHGKSTCHGNGNSNGDHVRGATSPGAGALTLLRPARLRPAAHLRLRHGAWGAPAAPHLHLSAPPPHLPPHAPLAAPLA